MMKRLLLYSLGLLLCIAIGCKKDGQSIKTYLLRQQIVADGVQGAIDTATYTYDDQNRLTTITDGVLPARVSFAFKYDNENRISIARKYNNQGTLIIEFDFYYTPTGSGYYFYGPTHISDTASFVYNDQNQLTKIQTVHSGSQAFTYDSKGNISSTEGFLANGSNSLFDQISYAYDDKKNPFSDTPKLNYYFMFVAYTDPSTLINNVVVKNANTYTYTYNSDGFPIKAVVNTDKAIYPIFYYYTVK